MEMFNNQLPVQQCSDS